MSDPRITAGEHAVAPRGNLAPTSLDSLIKSHLAATSRHLAPLRCDLGEVHERYYKLTAEALRVCCELVRVLRPEPPAADFDFRPHVGALFSCARDQLNKADQEHEVKECAISCMGLVI